MYLCVLVILLWFEAVVGFHCQLDRWPSDSDELKRLDELIAWDGIDARLTRPLSYNSLFAMSASNVAISIDATVVLLLFALKSFMNETLLFPLGSSDDFHLYPPTPPESPGCEQL